MNLTRDEAHLLLAAIRIQTHRLGRSPTPAEVADLLDRSETETRLQLVFLQELGAADLIDSAFESHAAVGDYSRVETLSEQDGPALSEDLKEFDRRQQAEAERLAHLFDSGDHDRRQQEKLQQMDEELREFRRQKPSNPFGDD